MVEDVELVPIPGIQDELVEFGVVGDRIAMEPVATVGSTGESAAGHSGVVDVEPLDVVGWISVVRKVGRHVLDQVVPGVPFPHDVPS